MVLRMLEKKFEENRRLRIFEGGAGVGAILREAWSTSWFRNRLRHIEAYYYTDVSLSLIKRGREWLKSRLPPEILDRFRFKVADLDKLELEPAVFTQPDSLDMIILEHVLYDVIDLDKTLRWFYRMLRPDGVLSFTMAFRTAPRHFFPFEFLQSGFQSYHKAKLETGFRENAGYLTLNEWEKSLARAGFRRFEVFPAAADQVRWPYGGMIAHPSK